MKKIPRGIIYHSPAESLQYLLRALFFRESSNKLVLKFEKTFAEFNGSQNCIAFPFARTAIYYVLKSLNLPEGSEVLMPPITIKGIVDVVVDLGLTPKYVEIDPETICFDFQDLSSKTTQNVRAAIITPLFGLVPNLEITVEFLKSKNVFIIEDFSQCLNGQYLGRRVGTFGDAGVYSASSIKTLDTLGGGMVITNNPVLAKYLREMQAQLAPVAKLLLVKKAWINLLRNIATTNPIFSFATFYLLQLIRMRNPNSALKQTGNRDKSRLSKLPLVWFTRYSELQASIGLKKISTVNKYDAQRIANVEVIKNECPTAKFPKTTPNSKNVYWQLILPLNDAYKGQEFLASYGIDSATSSLELVSSLNGYPGKIYLPIAEDVYKNGLFIPCFPNLSENDLSRISQTLNNYLASP